MPSHSFSWPVATVGFPVHCASMSEAPTAYIHAALVSLGTKCRTIEPSFYDPTGFGNLVAIAETSVGKLRIFYDRGFYVEAHERSESANVGQIVDALERHRAVTTNRSPV